MVHFPLERLADWDSIPALALAVVTLPLWLVLRGRRLAWMVAVVGVAACLVQAARLAGPEGMLDLQIYVGSARGWLTGGSLYAYRDANYGLSATYPPVGIMPFALLGPFGARGRDVLWALANVAMLALTCRLVATRLLGLREARATTWTLYATGLAALTVPVWTTVAIQGQVNVVLWLLVVADVGTQGRRPRWSGVGIGLATAIKLVPGLFVGWLLAIGDRRAVGRAVAVAVFATVLGWALAPDDSWRYWTSLLWDSGRVGDVADVQNNSLLGAIARGVPAGTVRTALWLVSAGLVMGVALWRGRTAARAGDLLASTVIVGCASALVSPISWTHHLGFLVLALAAITVDPRRPRTVALLLVAWVALMDPLGFGGDASTSTMRTLAMVAVVGLLRIVPGRSRPSSDDAAEVGPTSTTTTW